MAIIDRERGNEWIEQMNTILVFVCTTCVCGFAELIGSAGWVVRGLLERFPDRTPGSSRTRPHGYHTRRSNLPNTNDA